MDPDELEAIILQRIMDTTTTFQRAVFMVLLSMQNRKSLFRMWTVQKLQVEYFLRGFFLIPHSGGLFFFGLQGQLTEGVNVVDYLMEQPNVVPRINPHILSTDGRYLDFTANPGELC